MLSNIKAVADKFGCEFREDAPMSDYTSFKQDNQTEDKIIQIGNKRRGLLHD